jgi:hypothetical protein
MKRRVHIELEKVINFLTYQSVCIFVVASENHTHILI